MCFTSNLLEVSQLALAIVASPEYFFAGFLNSGCSVSLNPLVSMLLYTIPQSIVSHLVQPKYHVHLALSLVIASWALMSYCSSSHELISMIVPLGIGSASGLLSPSQRVQSSLVHAMGLLMGVLVNRASIYPLFMFTYTATLVSSSIITLKHPTGKRNMEKHVYVIAEDPSQRMDTSQVMLLVSTISGLVILGVIGHIFDTILLIITCSMVFTSFFGIAVSFWGDVPFPKGLILPALSSILKFTIFSSMIVTNQTTQNQPLMVLAIATALILGWLLSPLGECYSLLINATTLIFLLVGPTRALWPTMAALQVLNVIFSEFTLPPWVTLLTLFIGLCLSAGVRNFTYVSSLDSHFIDLISGNNGLSLETFNRLRASTMLHHIDSTQHSVKISQILHTCMISNPLKNMQTGLTFLSLLLTLGYISKLLFRTLTSL